jgi:hypothetical protein
VLHALLAIAGLLVLVVAAIPLARRNKRVFKAHNDEMQSWAESHSCSYVFEENSQYEGYSFYPFGQSDQQYAHRVVTGKYGERAIAVYDFYFAIGGGLPGGGNNTYFAMIVMHLGADVPWVHVTERKNLSHHADAEAISTGDDGFDAVYAVFAGDPAYAKSAVSATVRSGLPAHSLSGMHIVDGRLFLWQSRRKHDVRLLDDRLRFAATVAAELSATKDR